jgi:hypothetical protein
MRFVVWFELGTSSYTASAKKRQPGSLLLVPISPSPPSPVVLCRIAPCGNSTHQVVMSNSTITPHHSLQSQVCVLGPGITGLFLQGLETGLVVAQFCRWFSSTERNDGAAFSALVVFVTVVGLWVFFLPILFFLLLLCLTDYRTTGLSPKCAIWDIFRIHLAKVCTRIWENCTYHLSSPSAFPLKHRWRVRLKA